MINVLSASVKYDFDTQRTEWAVAIDVDLPEVLYHELITSVASALGEYATVRGFKYVAQNFSEN